MALTPQGKVAGWSLFIGVPVALFLAGVGVGRWTAPKPPAVEAETAKQASSAKAQATTQAQAQATATTAADTHLAETGSTKTTWRRAVPHPVQPPPGCPACLCDEVTVEQVVDRRKDTATTATTTRTEARATSLALSSAAVTEHTKLTISPRTRFSLTAIYGKTWDWKTEAGGVLSVRVAGPFHLSVWGTNRAAGAGLGVAW